MTTLAKTPARLLQVNDRVCGDFGVTYTVKAVTHDHDASVSVTWHTGRTVNVSPDEVFHVETSKQEG